ncbi:MAG: Ig-like domain-containing protein, partial [Candidatus Aminicenantes bacterium]|nr:Ig-like domain-containing protein [Candidatus Aminicenantes bacterium]
LSERCVMKKRTIFLSVLLIGLTVLATFLIAQVVPQDKYFVFVTKWSFSPEGMSPRCAFVDKNGNLYVSGDRKVLKYGRDGVRVMKIENLPNNDTFTFNSSEMWVAVDDAGNIYVVNQQDNNVFKFDADGNYLTKWGTVGSGDRQFNGPLGIAVDGSGNVYVGDRNNSRIQKFDSSGNFILAWGSGGSGDGQFSCVRELAFDSTRNELYVLEDCGNRRIQIFDTAGVFQSKVDLYPGGVGVLSPYGFCVGPDGYFYVADSNNGGINKIWKVPHPSVGGGLTEALGHNPGTDDYHFHGIYDVVFDSAGNLLLVDFQWNYGSARAMKYRPNGAPLIDILSPLSNASLSGTITIQTSVSMPDAGSTFSKVEFYRDNTKLGEGTPYNFNWDTTSTTNGPYALWAVASNTAGTLAKARVDIIVANGDGFPTISLTNPTLGAKVRGTVTLQATASDVVGLAKVEFYVDDRKVGQDTSDPFALDWNSTSVDDGEHEFRAVATDSRTLPSAWRSTKPKPGYMWAAPAGSASMIWEGAWSSRSTAPAAANTSIMTSISPSMTPGTSMLRVPTRTRSGSSTRRENC